MMPNVPCVTSSSQQQSWADQTIPGAEEVAPNLWMIAMPMPGNGMPYSFAYAKLGSNGVHILDPGWRGEENLERWKDFLGRHGRTLGDITGIVATHGHPDHVSLAAALTEVSGATLTMSSIEARILGGEVQTVLRGRDVVEARLVGWGVPSAVREELLRVFTPKDYPAPAVPDTVLEHGDRIDFGGTRLMAIHTPGHTGGHMCFVAHDDKLIFTGDHVLPHITPGLGLGALPGSDPVSEYVASLAAMREFEPFEVLGGHEYRFRGIAAASERIASHHLRKSRALQLISENLGDATVWEHARRVPWNRGWDNLSGFMLHAALTQTELHLRSLSTGALDGWLGGSWAVHV